MSGVFLIYATIMEAVSWLLLSFTQKATKPLKKNFFHFFDDLFVCFSLSFVFSNYTGAFLIPFSIMLCIAGLPLMFMELSFGQYAALGPVAIYQRFCPLLCGLGTGMIIVSAIVMLYYNLIIAWTIFYMFASFRTELPWQNCEEEWRSERKCNKKFIFFNYCFSFLVFLPFLN